MSQIETYQYNQGKVYLARRDAYGKPLAWRWIGDVSVLSLALSVENLSHKESYSGQRMTVRRFPISKDGTVSMTWHEFSADNLALVFYGERVVIPAGTVTGEPLPAGIEAGSRVTLEHQNVSDVEIGTLVPGTDFDIDVLYGAIDFLKTPAPAALPLTVNYSYAGSTNTEMFTQQPEPLALRFDGINLAEGGAAVIQILHKVVFDPAAALAMINSDTSLAGLETTAGVLFDTNRPADPVLSRFGRIIHVAEPAE